MLHRAWADGELPRPAGRRLPDASGWACRTGGGAAHDRASCRPTDSDHTWRRQSLRYRRLRQRAALDECDAACCAEHQGRSSAVDGRTTRHRGYAVSQRIRKRIEEAFGWIKTIAGQEQTRFRGRERVGWAFTFTAAAYNLVRLPKLIAEAG